MVFTGPVILKRGEGELIRFFCVPGTFPVIVINNSMSFERQIFTLFHELYHLISDTSGAEIIRDDYCGVSFYDLVEDHDNGKGCQSLTNGDKPEIKHGRRIGLYCK